MKSFVKRNEGFTCRCCGHRVLPHPSSSRDHCPYCLFSSHVDVFPGDRQNSCRGILEPVGLAKHQGKEQIVYRCQKCGQRVVNILAPDDNKEVVVKLSTLPINTQERR